MTDITYARLRATDPVRWRVCALDWRSWAAAAGAWVSELGMRVSRLRDTWSGAASQAAAAHVARLRRGLTLFRLICWEADQALSEFAAALSRARAMLDRAVDAAARSKLVIDDQGTVRTGPAVAGRPLFDAVQAAAVEQVSADIAAAVRVAESADTAATGRLTALAAADPGGPPPPASPLPPSTATPADVRRWWDGLTPAQRRWLVATEPGWLGARDGVPAAYRDLANRLLLDDRRAEVERAITGADGDLRRLRGIRDGLNHLADRLADEDGPRAYLMRLDLAGEGQAVVALGDPDRADHVLTHVPGMTADLKSYAGELSRAERVAVHAATVSPGASTSAVTWLGYDSPDFVDEAAGRGRADAGAPHLRRFQEGLRASHDGEAHLTVLGHSYGSLVVGSAAATPGLQADDVIFVGSPGVGVESVRDLAVPPERVWATASRTDVIQYAPVSPRSLLEDAVAAHRVPVAGPLLAFGRPEDDLWHGHNPADPAFGARVFATQADAGHLGYWEPGRPALDALTDITVGRDVTPR